MLKEHRTFVNNEGHYYTNVGMYTVIQKAKRFCGVYDRYGIFITHRTSWKQAIKIAKLLNGAFQEGREYSR